MIPNAPELNKKLTISWAALVAIVIVTVMVTGTAVKVLDNDVQRAEQKAYFDKQLEDTKTFLLGEIEGLRSDWQRRYEDDVNKRLDKLEKEVKDLPKR